MIPHVNPRKIAIVTACMNAHDGTPTFALTEVSVTDDEAENGVQYDRAEAALHNRGYEEPFVHFPDFEAPSFLHDAVRQHLGRSAGFLSDTQLEERECTESSK